VQGTSLKRAASSYPPGREASSTRHTERCEKVRARGGLLVVVLGQDSVEISFRGRAAALPGHTAFAVIRPIVPSRLEFLKMLPNNRRIQSGEEESGGFDRSYGKSRLKGQGESNNLVSPIKRRMASVLFSPFSSRYVLDMSSLPIYSLRTSGERAAKVKLHPAVGRTEMKCVIQWRTS